MGRIVVVGSINMDIVAEVSRMPRGGETIVGDKISQMPGGKGANQAVAAVRAGAPTVLVGALGDDAFGDTLITFLSNENLDTGGVSRVPGPSGTTVIALEHSGENRIIIIPGANNKVPEDVVAEFAFSKDDVVLLQNEIPEAVNNAAAKSARAAGARVVLNTAPYRPIETDLLDSVDIVIANETEFSELLADAPADLSRPAVAELLAGGAAAPHDLIVTLGGDGVVARLDGEVFQVDAHQVTVRDTTGAGDSFCGALAAALASGEGAAQALRYANATAAIAVQEFGASPSMPTQQQVRDFLADAQTA